jgi:hypothetical protein
MLGSSSFASLMMTQAIKRVTDKAPFTIYLSISEFWLIVVQFDRILSPKRQSAMHFPLFLTIQTCRNVLPHYFDGMVASSFADSLRVAKNFGEAGCNFFFSEFGNSKDSI